MIIFNAAYLLSVLPRWEEIIQSFLPGTDEALHLQTFNERLYSFMSLTSDPGMWSFFGLPVSERGNFALHDAISQTLVEYGAIPLIVFVGLLIAVLCLSHQLVWREHDLPRRKYVALLLSMVFANLFTGALMQSHINIFPINFIFWFCVGALLKVVFQERSSRLANTHQALEPLPDEVEVPSMGGRRGRLAYGH